MGLLAGSVKLLALVNLKLLMLLKVTFIWASLKPDLPEGSQQPQGCPHTIVLHVLQGMDHLIPRSCDVSCPVAPAPCAALGAVAARALCNHNR